VRIVISALHGAVLRNLRNEQQRYPCRARSTAKHCRKNAALSARGPRGPRKSRRTYQEQPKVGSWPVPVRSIEVACQLFCGRAVLNLCMPYSSRDEIATAVEETVHDALLEGRTE
jgi:hypothetical protein